MGATMIQGSREMLQTSLSSVTGRLDALTLGLLVVD